MLYNIIIAPIEIIVDWVFSFISNRFESLNIIYSVIGVSLAINFLALPLYNIADKLQEKERNISRALEPRLKRIKKAFKGDEQFMMISEYYRQNNYHPIYVLRSSLSILIEIPFFIAAYHYLSNCEQLAGANWFIFKDLGNPDELIKVSIAGINLTINILPILMTLINFVSGAIYCKEAPIREKLQLYGVAIVFLILLYKSPSGLVIYWILNNIFSLFKNIVIKMKNPKRILHIILTICLACLTIMFWCFKANTNLWKKCFLSALTLFFAMIPFLYSKFKNCSLFLKTKNIINSNDNKQTFLLFISSCIALWIFNGLLLPASVIASSPIEFSFIGNTQNPLKYIFSSFEFFFGMFCLWPFIIYKLFGNNVKKILPIILFEIIVCALFNVYLFKPNYGTLNTLFQIESSNQNLKLSNIVYLLSIFLSIIVLILYFVFHKTKKLSILSFFIFSISFAGICLGCYKISQIKKEYVQYASKRVSEQEEIKPVYHLSKTEKNVVILFLDRAIGSFPSYIFEQFPEIKNEFTGFTYYPNTLSTGSCTINGIPTIMGGYEYTSYENYKRDDMLLVDKHNEALLVMPKLFLDAGYEVTFTDPSMSNYVWEGDYTPFDKYPEINVSGQLGKYNKKYIQEKNISSIIDSDKYVSKQLKNFSILQAFIPFLRIPFYNTNFTLSETFTEFYNSMATLYYLPELTDFISCNNTFTIIENELPHRPTLLNIPEYEVPLNKNDSVVKNNVYKNFNQLDLMDYDVNIAAFKQASKFIRYLKENGIYDNTRIIIVSDHGYYHHYTTFDDFENPIVPSQFNCLLMFKDFNSNEPLKTDMTFMTNADTLFFAKKDLEISNINPFTKKEFQQDKDFVICCPLQSIEGNKLVGNQYNPNYMRTKNKMNYSQLQCWKVHDNIFNPENWEQFNFQ